MIRPRPRRRRRPVDLSTRVGTIDLPNPVMTASGTAGYGAELAAYVDLASLGAVVVKSLAAFAWDGNPPPRVHETPAGMLNSVGLQGPGVEAWLAEELPQLLATGGRRIIASIWGRSIDEYQKAAAMLGDAPAEVLAVEVNLSCPNTEAGRELFAHDPEAAGEVIDVTAACGRPRWAKLSPNTDRLVEVATAAQRAGAEALTLVNTVFGLQLDIETRRPVLGAGGGGLSGPAIHPIAVRAIADVHAALPETPLVGVGGIASGEDAVELLLAGASAVQVGTATFHRPTAPAEVLTGLERWCQRHRVQALSDLIGGAHGV